mmetsp:Transcript_13080/g.41265  ORF Transcript_13080/g.41265 Transcript_13080/m.41265 type:complete len:253 (+) Transcript_13080:192-950(+)
MAVRLGGYPVGRLHGELRRAVGQRRDLLLLDDQHLLRRQAEVVPLLQQRLRALQGVAAHHNDQRQPAARAPHRGEALESTDVGGVEPKHAAPGGDVGGQSELHTCKSEALAEPSRRDDEATMRQLLQPGRLVSAVVLRTHLQPETGRGHGGGPAVEGVLPLGRALQQLPGVAQVLAQPTGVVRVEGPHLPEESVLLRVRLSNGRPRPEQRGLPGVHQHRGQLALVRAEQSDVGPKARDVERPHLQGWGVARG